MYDFRIFVNPSQLIYRTVKSHGQANASSLITFAALLFISPNEVLSNCVRKRMRAEYERLQLHIFTYLSGAFTSLRDLSGISAAHPSAAAHLYAVHAVRDVRSPILG